MNMTRVLFIITGLEGGGAEKALVNLLRAMDKQTYNISVLVIFGDKKGTDIVDGVTYHTLFGNNHSIVYKIAKHLYLDWHTPALLTYLTRRKVPDYYDVIVSFLEGDSLLYHSFVFDRAQRNISWVHTDLVENHWSARHFVGEDEKKAYSTLNGVVFVSEYAQTQFNKVFHLSENIKQYICPNIINETEIVQKSQELVTDVLKRTFTICSVGRLEEVKGYDMVVEAARILKRQGTDVDFWIIGTGSQEKRLRALIQGAGVDDIVHLLGYKANPYPYMRMADIFLYSSRAEGLPLVFGEAMCLGKPIVATRTIGALTILQDGEYGKIVDMSPSAIAGIITELQMNHSLLAHCGELSRIGKKQFDAQNVLVIKEVVYIHNAF